MRLPTVVVERDPQGCLERAPWSARVLPMVPTSVPTPRSAAAWVALTPLFVALAPGPAYSQIPPLPEVNGPSLRLAGDDPLEDQFSTLLSRVEPELTQRRAALEALGPAPAEGAAEANPSVAMSLKAREALEEEIQRLARAVDQAQDGWAKLRVSVPARIHSNFRDLWSAREQALRLEALAEQRDARARRLRSMSEGKGAKTATTGAEARLLEQFDRAQRAQTDEATAEALRTRVELKNQHARVRARRAGLSVEPKEIEEAEKALKVAEAEVEEARAELAARKDETEQEVLRAASSARDELRGTLRRLEVEVLVRAVSNAEARRTRAAIEKAAVEALAAGERPEYPPEIGLDAVAAAQAEVAEARVEAAARSVEFRARLRVSSRTEERALQQIRDRLEDVLGSLAEEAEVLAVAEALIQLVDGSLALERTTEELATAIGLSLIVVFLVILFFLRVLPALQALDKRRVETDPEAPTTRAFGIAILFLPPVVLVAAAAVVTWPIWQIPFGVGEVSVFLQTPLFYVDQEPISALSIAKLLGTVWLTVLFSRLVRGMLVDRFFRRLSLDTGVAHTFGTLFHYAFLTVVGLSSFALLAGVLGIGIGFGLRNVTENFISGLIVLFERPIKVGDWITLEGGLEAQVTRIRARATTVRSRDFVSIIIPNSEFVAKQVTNWSHGERRVRLGVRVGLAYGSDTDLVRKTLLGVAERDGRVLRSPPPEVHLQNFGTSSLDFVLYVWIGDSMVRPRIESDLRFSIDASFRKAKLVIAFPQLDLHLASDPGLGRLHVPHRPNPSGADQPVAEKESQGIRPAQTRACGRDGPHDVE